MNGFLKRGGGGRMSELNQGINQNQKFISGTPVHAENPTMRCIVYWVPLTGLWLLERETDILKENEAYVELKKICMCGKIGT